MVHREEVSGFIRSTFRSIWSLELLLLLKQSGRSWSQSEMVASLRASDLIVSQGVDSLLAAGLVVAQDDGQIHFGPASADLARLADLSENAYAKSPDAVRRLIVAAAADGLSAFADAFRLRKD